MGAARYDLYIEQGATFQRECQYNDVNGDPIDLSGMTMGAQIRATYSANEVIQEITVTILDQSQPENLGKFVLTISSDDTAEIPVQIAQSFENTTTNYTWDLELNTGGTVRRLMQGAVIVSPEVTKYV